MDTDLNTLDINVVITVAPATGETAAHIHGFAPPGTPAIVLFPLPLGSPKIATWPFMESDQANIIAGLTYVNIHSNAFPLGEIRGQIVRVPTCGDGILDAGEDCDDGNNDNGDCCSSVCTFETAGNPCVGSTLCSASGTCDGAGACQAAPFSSCRTALKSILLIKNDAPDSKDKLIWKWIKGAMTTQADFGNPTTSTDYALCIFAGTANVLAAEVPASASRWSPVSDKGYKYKDTSGTPIGITKVLLKGGDAGKAKCLVKGKGPNLPDPTLGSLPLPVKAQLVNSSNSICFEGEFDAPDVIKNTPTQFKAKAQ